MSPGGSSTLADLVVNFTVDGADALSKSLAGIEAAIGKVADGLAKTGKAPGSIEKQTTASMAFAVAIGTLTAKVVGYAESALRASAYGSMMNFQLGEIARQIGSLFVPEMQKLIGLLQQAVNWFRNLSGDQQRALAHAIEFSIGIKLVSKALAALNTNPIFAIASILATAISLSGQWGPVLDSLGAAFDALAEPLQNFMKAVSGLLIALAPLGRVVLGVFSAMVVVLSKIITALAWIIERAADIASVFKSIYGPDREKGISSRARTELPRNVGGFESLESSYQRITAATLKIFAGGKGSIDEQLLEEAKKTAANTAALANRAPVVAH